MLSTQSMKAFSELTGQEKSVELLRWLLVPVAAALAVIVPDIIARLVMAMSDFYRVILPWLDHGLIGAAFVNAGAKTAPRGRLATAIVLAVLWSLSALLSHVLMQPSPGIRNYAHFAVAALSAVGGAAYFYYSEKSKRSPPCPEPSPPS